MNTYDPGQVAILVMRLRDLGVSLSDDLHRSADQLIRLPAMRPQPEPPADLIGLTDEELTEALRQLGIATALAGSHGPGASALGDMTRALGQAVAAELREIADDVLDQLRPRFDAAAATIHDAAKLGINARTNDRDILRADNVTTWRDAWSSIPPTVRTLDSIASARIQLTMTAGCPPAPNRMDFNTLGPSDAVHAVAGAMFRSDAPDWRRDFEETWQMWLRLCASSPAELLTLEQSTAAASQMSGSA